MKNARLGALLSGALLAFAIAGDASARIWTPRQLSDLTAAAAAAPAEGLPPETESLAELARLQALTHRDATASAALNQTADALFAHLAFLYAQGGADPALADPAWMLPRPAPADAAALDHALDTGAAPSSVLQSLLPQSTDYVALRAELARVMADAGAAPIDGLNRDDQILRLRATLERLRWLPRQWPTRRIEVRINQFEVTLYRDEAPPLALSAIVGAARSQTPSFQASLRTITLNPSWEPPRSIVNELLPQFRRDPAKADREGFDVLDASGTVIDPANVDWSARPFRYRLRQRPGPHNALGRIRFDLPNPFAIYLHDTPNRALFERSNRAFSHGCIRVENPTELAAAVSGDPAWTADAIRATIATGATTIIQLEAPTPIYVLYLTAAASEDGGAIYFGDIYHRDAAVVRVLDSPQVSLAALTPRRTPLQPVCRPA